MDIITDMREIILKIDEVKRRVGMIVGQPMTFEINRGRNKFVKFEGYVQDAYPAIFTVRCLMEGEDELQSYSYNDILTRNVKINKK
ncbi:MAG: Veg family protein [Clostridia bacterium]|nr:Veg family protein [Clostridia bacterium]MDE7215897.1 Veg family protein [Clostridia bacterium]MDE7336999.1 Veg family protein [Clostridia bacterium]